MNYYLTAFSYLFASLLPIVFGSIRHRLLDKPSRTMFLLLVVAFLTECGGTIAAIIYHNNLPVYNVSNIIQLGIIVTYFNNVLRSYSKLKIGKFITLFCVLAGILNLIFFESINIYNSNYFLFQTVMVLIMGVWLMVQFVNEPYFEMLRSPHFWFAFVLMMFYTLGFFAFALYDYFTIHLNTNKYIIDYAIVFLNWITYLSFASIFLFYPKMTPENVR